MRVLEITDLLLKSRSWPLGVSSSLGQRRKQVIMVVEMRVVIETVQKRASRGDSAPCPASPGGGF